MKLPKKDIAKFVSRIPQGGHILDLGCGKGLNAVFLARAGFNVTAVDISKEKLEELEKEAKNYSLLDKIHVINQDIRDFQFTQQFVAIVCTDVLHFLEKANINKIVDKMKEYTIKNGIHFVSVFTKKGELKWPRAYFFEHEELKRFYDDWNILFYSEEFRKTLEKDKLGNPKTHEVATLVAQRI